MTSNSKKMAIYILIAIFFVSLDRFLKMLALLKTDYKLSIIGQLFSFDFEKNFYIAFSLPLPILIIKIMIIMIIFALLLYFIRCLSEKKFDEAGLLIIIIFGAISNVLDRLRFGFVIDYFNVKYFTIFNIADVMIVVGIILLFYFYLKNPQTKNKIA